jgi:hypothetical protein
MLHAVERRSIIQPRNCFDLGGRHGPAKNFTKLPEANYKRAWLISALCQPFFRHGAFSSNLSSQMCRIGCCVADVHVDEKNPSVESGKPAFLFRMVAGGRIGLSRFTASSPSVLFDLSLGAA